MLTDDLISVQSGRLDFDIHLPSTAKIALIDFIVSELPGWRDHCDRPAVDAETKLTEYLCDYLNSSTYHSTDWSHVQFRTETGDEMCGGRTIDLTVKPRAAAIIIEGRRHSQFQALFPIECKRLPTPKGKDRDVREYVTSESSTTGGIQRFKFGYHGAKHNFAAMIAYVQKQNLSYWLKQVNFWIHGLSEEPNSVWSDSDLLQLMKDKSDTGVVTLISRHQRNVGIDECELRHIWIKMNNLK